MLVNDFVGYLKKPVSFPKYSNVSLSQVLTKIFLLYVFYGVVILILAIALSCYSFLLKSAFHLTPMATYHLKMQNLAIHYGKYSIVLICILIPFIEEIISRLWLSLNKLHISISLVFIAFRLTGPSILKSNIYETEFYIRIIASILLSFIFYKWIKQETLNKLKSHYNYIFYLSVVSFGLLHLANFNPLGVGEVFLFSLLVLPQVVMGIFIGYVRVNFSNGFIWGILFHALINLPITLLGKF